jgi:phosphoglycerate dehydrogenase-like enzyme
MISEWVILQILSASHRQKKLIGWQNQHVWGNYLELGPRKDAVGMRFGVLGYGSIGRQGQFHLFKAAAAENLTILRPQLPESAKQWVWTL